MRMILSIVISAFLLLGEALSAESQETKKDTMSQKEKVSYSIGVDMARNFKRQGIQVDVDLVIKGLKDGLSGEKLLMPEEDLRNILTAFQNELRRRQAQAFKIAAEDSRKKGETFLAENKKKEGVLTLPSGLQYKILKEGSGKKPTEADTVECHYRGTLIDGTDLDSSKAGKPATLKVTGVIPGWKEALQLMPVGSKWVLFIPPHLAYGERGADGRIGPNATLIFEVDLLAIK